MDSAQCGDLYEGGVENCQTFVQQAVRRTSRFLCSREFLESSVNLLLYNRIPHIIPTNVNSTLSDHPSLILT
ncbi:hypothetical protein WAI453_010542 [Rhynchosporium graminicola]